MFVMRCDGRDCVVEKVEEVEVNMIIFWCLHTTFWAQSTRHYWEWANDTLFNNREVGYFDKY